jgi:hypothetical protein
MLFEIIKISIICFVFWTLSEPGQIFNWYFSLIEDLPHWLQKPLGGCVRCMSGQVLFWYYLIVHFNEYRLLDHLFYPAAGIILATILERLYEKNKL